MSISHLEPVKQDISGMVNILEVLLERVKKGEIQSVVTLVQVTGGKTTWFRAGRQNVPEQLFAMECWKQDALMEAVSLDRGM